MAKIQNDFEVSVVVPVRDERSNIRQVTESLLGQTEPPKEVLIADGGSTDGSQEVVRELAAQGRPVRLVEHPDAYPGRARNLGIARVTTDWVAITDAGTVIPDDWLASLRREAAGNGRADVVLGSYEPVLGSFFQECLALAFVAPPRKIGDRLVRGPSTASMMLKKTVWESLGRFPEELRACEDLLFFERLQKSEFVVKCAPDAVVRWNIPHNFAGVFRRFRAYSEHTLRAGLAGQWHRAVARMYLVAIALGALAVFHHPAWLVPLAVGAGWRVHRAIARSRPSLTLAHRVGPHTYVVVAVILAWIDCAALVGGLVYFSRDRWRSRRA